MLEKIGLRGTHWVIDASHCQGCSSQFTFINRKHHCRRCEGIFCYSCTQHRMVLRGHGDSPVRVCEPCKNLEEAARFESRHGYKSRAGRGRLKPTVNDEDVAFNQILGGGIKESSSSGVALNNDTTPSVQGATCSNVQEVVGHDGGGEIHKSPSVDQCMQNGMALSSPEKLRQQALDEKRKYKVLKGEGKSEEALRAFKRGKELERQAEKNGKNSFPSENMSGILNKEVPEEYGRKNKVCHPASRDKDDLAAKLRELGWSDMDLRDDDKKNTNLSLDGELSSLLGEIPEKINGHGIDKTEVVAFKKKALMLKQKQLEEQELLAGAEDSDDEVSAIIRSMDNDKQDEILMQYEHTQGLDFDYLMETADDLGIDSDLEVTDQDMENLEIDATLKSFGWTEDSSPIEDVTTQSALVKREALLNEIISLKREALSQKRAGNVAEAMAMKGVNLKPASKSRLTIQKELLSLKKKALALRQQGRLDESDEELQKGRILEQQLEEMENTSNMKAAQVTSKGKDLKHEHPNVSDTLPVEGDVMEQDLHDPTCLSILRNLGWNDSDDELSNSSLKHSEQNGSKKIIESSSAHAPPKIPTKASRRTKAEIQREILGLKRKTLLLRRQGNPDEAEEVLETAKALEAEMAEMEAPKKVVESRFPKEKAAISAHKGAAEEEDAENITENDMTDPPLLSMLKNLGWKDEEAEPITMQEEYSKTLARLEAPKSELVVESSKDSKSENFESFANHKRLGNSKNEVIVKKEPFVDNQPSVEKSDPVGLNPPSNQSANIMELSTVDDLTNSQIPAKLEETGHFESNFFSRGRPDVQLACQDVITKNEDSTGKTRVLNEEKSYLSQNSQDSRRRAVLSHKRKALALKRDGKLAEAREELRQAKLLEKSMAEDDTPPKFGSNDVSTSAFTVCSSAAIEQGTPAFAPKPLSGHVHFKLQQESLSHKRQALKLRREGRMQEAEAEFELAKSLEARLEELGGHASTKSSSNRAEPVDDVVVEDLLDPQLLSALKAIGLDDSSAMAQGPKRTEFV
ncbi:hypothetical protein ERO13_D10G017600v2 [Gossypium hirsutum]|nr:hypothetical protein ERO13_D10G017600v2 [Gossypium hirsutum]